MGDPAGVGPEIIVKTLSGEEFYQISVPVVIGEETVLRRAAKLINKSNLEINCVKEIKEAKGEYGTIDLMNLNNVEADSIKFGQVDEECGRAAIEYIKRAVALAQDNKIQAIVTGPIHKEAIVRAGFNYPGHTELLAELCAVKDYALMLVDEDFRIAHVTCHLSLKRACEEVKLDRILTVIRLGNEALKRLGIESPRIAIAGLNPHAGEGGLFGREEIEEIIPAIQLAKKEGIKAEGPIPPDTIFSKTRGSQYDLAVAMYHDQGHIAMKVAGFIYDKASERWTSISGVNITLGLPIIRTSVDHGVAFDQAGKGTANPQSLKQAIRLALQLVRR
ncbi:4-hydroxythreonine-4-phosphate dehydrogenase PdxA [candidate division NPL-UPA2 bacterium]|nr:4-hydroxythreonine-4-phosphate dehydrogenase PdxA [candidate division NPL-UPA2 bacterium]